MAYTIEAMQRERLLTEAYEQIKAMIPHLAKKFKARYGGLATFDDLVSEGHLAFIKAWETYDPDQGTSWPTWARQRIWFSLLDNARKWKQRQNRCAQYNFGDQGIDDVPTGESKFLDRLVSYVSKDSATILGLLFSSTTDMMAVMESEPRHVRNALRVTLKQAGWVPEQVKNCFEEIHRAL